MKWLFSVLTVFHDFWGPFSTYFTWLLQELQFSMRPYTAILLRELGPPYSRQWKNLWKTLNESKGRQSLPWKMWNWAKETKSLAIWSTSGLQSVRSSRSLLEIVLEPSWQTFEKITNTIWDMIINSLTSVVPIDPDFQCTGTLFACF